jgi:hypothetical protein
MTAVSSEGDICDHERTGFEFGEDIFFTDADCYPSWFCEIGDSTREESAIFDGIEDRKYLLTEGITVLLEKIRYTSDTIYTRIWRRTKCEVVGGTREGRDEVVETVIVKFVSIFLWYDRCTDISLRCYFDEIVHIHANTSCCRKSSCRIIWLIDESHFLELFHVVADSRWRDVHAFITNEGLTSCRVATLDIFPDDESEDLDFSSIDGRLATHFFYELKIKKEKLKMEDF